MLRFAYHAQKFPGDERPIFMVKLKPWFGIRFANIRVAYGGT